jgi:DUF4097 and DUF4098 domain-containing protein YvlB
MEPGATPHRAPEPRASNALNLAGVGARRAKHVTIRSKSMMHAAIATRRGLGLATALTAVLATTVAAQQRYEVAGSDVAIYNLAGLAVIEGGSGSAVTVEVTTMGRDAGRLQVETGPIDGRATLRVIYPDRDIVYARWQRGSETQIRVRDDGTFNDQHAGRRRDDGNRVHITGGGNGLEAYADLRITVPRGQRISVYLAVGEAEVANVDGDLRVDVSSATIKSNNTKGKLVLDTGSGGINATNHEGDAVLDTGSGSVTVAGVRGDALLVDTGSGGVDAADVEVRSLSIDTGSGGIDVRNAGADEIVLDTGSGSVTVELVRSPRDLEIDTGSGGVTLIVPPDFGARVEIDTGSGGIDVDFPLQVRRWERTYLSGSIGDGSGRLHIDTGSGSVRVRKAS